MQGSRTSLKMEFTRWRFTAPTRPHIHRFSVPSKDIDELPHSAYHKNQTKKPFLRPQPTNSIQTRSKEQAFLFPTGRSTSIHQTQQNSKKKRKKKKQTTVYSKKPTINPYNREARRNECPGLPQVSVLQRHH